MWFGTPGISALVQVTWHTPLLIPALPGSGGCREADGGPETCDLDWALDGSGSPSICRWCRPVTPRRVAGKHVKNAAALFFSRYVLGVGPITCNSQ